MKFLILLILSLLIFPVGFGQDMSPKLNKAIEKDNFRKVERIFKRIVKRHRNGMPSDSGMQSSYTPVFDSLVSWLKKHPNVEDAVWDRCAIKIMIYPGSSVVGATFKTKNGTKEMCFHIQQGTINRTTDKMKNRLIYKKMYACEGFVKQEKQNCAGK